MRKRDAKPGALEWPPAFLLRRTQLKESDNAPPEGEIEEFPEDAEDDETR